jgi:hypothetical protein
MIRNRTNKDAFGNNAFGCVEETQESGAERRRASAAAALAEAAGRSAPFCALRVAFG